MAVNSIGQEASSIPFEPRPPAGLPPFAATPDQPHSVMTAYGASPSFSGVPMKVP